MTAFSALQETFINRWTNLMFLVGKTIRGLMLVIFMLLLRENVQEIGGYSSGQMLAFLVTYGLVDTAVQVFFRGIYTIGRDVRSGAFDGVLVKPINPLFTVLTGKPDINDAFFMILVVGVGGYLLATSGLDITWVSTAWYVLLLINSFILATALHVIIAAITLYTTDIDNVIWMYRDLTRMGQFPINIYFEVIRLALFFLIPVGMMFTIPAQVLLNTQPSYSLVVVSGFTVFFVWLSLRIWHAALKTYSSASS